MDNLEYLNHIAKSNRPTKSAKSGVTNSLIVKILVGGLLLFALIFIIGGMLGGSTKSSDLVKQLYTRTTNLESTLGTYNPSLKSSKLRAIGLSLVGTLANASSQISSYITTTDDSKNALVPKEEIMNQETENNNALNLALENAKLNGILDRTYATQIQLQVSLLLSLISQLSSRSDDEALINILNNYASSLTIIEQSFQNFSDPSA